MELTRAADATIKAAHATGLRLMLFRSPVIALESCSPDDREESSVTSDRSGNALENDHDRLSPDCRRSPRFPNRHHGNNLPPPPATSPHPSPPPTTAPPP